MLYGRCDDELGAPLQPFVEALRPLVPALGAKRLLAVHGIDELSRVVPEIAELVPDASRTSNADPDAERYALFDAICRALTAAATSAARRDLPTPGSPASSTARGDLASVPSH